VRSRACLAALVLVGLAAPAFAHEVLHEVQRGRAVAVHAWFPDGEDLAYVQAEVFSPADEKVPYWKGRTDRSGWLAFVPNVPGKWRVRIIDNTGHGLDTLVDVATLDGAAAEKGSNQNRPRPWDVLMRPLLGVAVIGAIFGFLYLRGRRRRS
jgi:nickel transport protein